MGNNLGQIISSRQKSLKLTQEKLVDMIEHSPGLIGQVERGETNPSYETLCRLKNVLQFNLNDAYSMNEAKEFTANAEVGYLMNQWDNDKQDFLLEFFCLLNERFLGQKMRQYRRSSRKNENTSSVFKQLKVINTMEPHILQFLNN